MLAQDVFVCEREESVASATEHVCLFLSEADSAGPVTTSAKSLHLSLAVAGCHSLQRYGVRRTEKAHEKVLMLKEIKRKGVNHER